MKPIPIPRRNFLRSISALAALGLNPSQALTQNTEQRKPNIIFILADDLGWAELGCYGNTFNETPHLDRLARNGIRFDCAYAAAPVCSPYRASLMTGQYPARVGITDYLRPNDPKHLDEDLVTLPETFHNAGYKTGIIGKWHLTGYKNHGAHESSPDKHGFDEVIISENRGISSGSYFFPYHFNREITKKIPGKEHLVDRSNLEALDFIERHQEEPFFLYLSHYAVHTKLDGKPELVQKYQNKPGAGKDHKAKHNNPHLAAQLECIDQGVGDIVHKLRDLQLLDDTIIVFTSDNGGEDRVTTNHPLRAGKSTLYEGGVREPLIVHWPGNIKAGNVCQTPVCSIDFYPTLCDLAKTSIPKQHPLDGVSFSTLLKEPNNNFPERNLYWYYPLEKPHFLGGRSAGSIRSQNWKLIEFYDTNEIELYDLNKDIGEQHNLAKQNPNKSKELLKQLRTWRDKNISRHKVDQLKKAG